MAEPTDTSTDGVAFNDDATKNRPVWILPSETMTGTATWTLSAAISIFSDETSTLYHYNPDHSFTDVTFASGLGVNTQYLGWGCMFLDVDNDGWLDLLLVNGHVYPEVGAETWAPPTRRGCFIGIQATGSSRTFRAFQAPE